MGKGSIAIWLPYPSPKKPIITGEKTTLLKNNILLFGAACCSNQIGVAWDSREDMKSVKKSTFIATCVVSGLALLYLSVLQVILRNESSESFYQPTSMSRSMMPNPSAGAVSSLQHSRPGTLGSQSAGSSVGLSAPAVSRRHSATYAIRRSALGAGASGWTSRPVGVSSSAMPYALPSSATRGGAMARVSAGGGVSPASGGLYTTSSGQLHSYGGGGNGGATRAGGSTSGASGASASAGLAGGGSLSLGAIGGTSYTPTYTLALSTNTLSSSNTSGSDQASAAAAMAAMAAQSGNYGIYSQSNGFSSYSAYNGNYLSADAYLAYNSGIPNRAKAPTIGGEGTYLQWLESKLWGYAGGNMQLTIQELQDLYNAACSEDAEFAETHSFEDFLNWFIETQDTREGFKWHLPVGNSLIPLLILALLYVGYKCLRRTAQDKAA